MTGALALDVPQAQNAAADLAYRTAYAKLMELIGDH